MSGLIATREITRPSEWDHLIGGTDATTAFHSWEWLTLVGEAFGDQPHFLTLSTTDATFAVGVAEASSGLMSPRIGYGGAIQLDGSGAPFPNSASSAITKLLGKNFVRVVDAPRSLSPWSAMQGLHMAPASTRELDPEQTMLALATGSAHRSVRSSLATADKFGLEVVDLEASDLATVYALYCETMDRVGASYRTTQEFLERLLLLGASRCWMLGAVHEGRIIAASIFLRYRHHVIHWIAAYAAADRHMMPNQTILREALRRSATDGIKAFNLGSSHSQGIDDAKARWGGSRLDYAVWSQN